MKHLRGIVESPTAPNTTDVLWLDSDGGLKAFKNGEWKALVEKGSGGNNGGNTNQENVMYIEEIQGDCYVDGVQVNDIVYNPIGFGSLIDANVYKKIKDNNITNFVFMGYYEGIGKLIHKSLNYREYSDDGHIEFWYMDHNGKVLVFSIYESEPEL